MQNYIIIDRLEVSYSTGYTTIKFGTKISEHKTCLVLLIS